MTWKQIHDYEILNFQFSNDFVAVYAEEADDGMIDLHKSPVDAIGVAKVTTRNLYFDKPGRPGRYDDEEPCVTTQVVGLELLDGTFEICNEATNFAGLARVGEDISKATGNLRGDLLNKLRPTSTITTI